MANFSDWEVIDDGSFNGTRKYIRSNGDEEGTIQIRYEGMDIPLIRARNKAAQSENQKIGDGLHKVASVPNTILIQWFMEDGVWAPDDMEYMTRKLNDPDWRYLKCHDIYI